MKSEKVEKYLFENGLGYPYTGYVTEQAAERAIELAEQEAEERVREELTQWHDPKEVLPDNDCDVLIKTTLCREYCIAFYKADGARNYHWHENNGALDDDMVIGWREIH